MSKENESCKRILNYIKSNPNLDSTKKRLLISYAAQLYINNVENVEVAELKNIFEDLQRLNESFEKSDNTSIIAKRLNEELKLYEMLSAFLQNNESDLSEISYELDQLYLRSDLRVRQKSTLSYDLDREKGNGRTK